MSEQSTRKRVLLAAVSSSSGLSPETKQHKHGPAREASLSWYQRQDVWAWVGGMLFCAALIGAIYGIGGARGWDADSGFTHNQSKTSPERFWPEPFVDEPGVPGRYGVGASSRWYYWKLPPTKVTLWSRLFCWVGYVAHQICMWLIIYRAQVVKNSEAAGLSKYSSDMKTFNWAALMSNIFFHVLHLINTHVTYDATAQDVSIASSQSSVIMLLVLVVLIEYRERGIVFGWPTTEHKGKWSQKLRLNYGPINLFRKYHGYAFAWGAIYTFWYHPMENTLGHAMGFMYTWMITLQGCLIYTDFHLNKYWRVMLEMWVIVHGGVVAAQTGGPDLLGTRLWPMFVFGFALCFVITQLFSLPMWKYIPSWTRVIPLLIYAAITLWAYSWIPDDAGRTWIRINEIIRIPATYYLYFFVGWALLLAMIKVERKCTDSANQKSSQSISAQLFYFTASLSFYAIFVGISLAIQLGDLVADLILMMILLVGVFIIGVAFSIMFLKHSIPTRFIKTDSTIKDNMNLSHSKTYDTLHGNDNPAYNSSGQ